MDSNPMYCRMRALAAIRRGGIRLLLMLAGPRVRTDRLLGQAGHWPTARPARGPQKQAQGQVVARLRGGGNLATASIRRNAARRPASDRQGSLTCQIWTRGDSLKAAPSAASAARALRKHDHVSNMSGVAMSAVD